MPRPLILEITVSSDTSLLRTVLSAVRSFAEQAGLGDLDASHVEIACDEACTNVMHHAYDKDPNREYRVRLESDGDVLHLMVFDRGEGFNPLDLPPPSRPESTEAMKIGGLGVFLCKKMMDSFSYTTTKDGENCLHMTKIIRPGSRQNEAQGPSGHRTEERSQ